MDNDTIRETFYTKIRDLQKEMAALLADKRRLSDTVAAQVAEMAALRARGAQLEEAVEWACDELLRDENAESEYDTYAETAGADEAESWAVWLEAELRRRARKKG